MTNKHRRRDLTVGMRHKDVGLVVQAKQNNRRTRRTRPTLSSAGEYQPLGDPNASCTGRYPDVDGTYADCGDHNCLRHVPAAQRSL